MFSSTDNTVRHIVVPTGVLCWWQSSLNASFVVMLQPFCVVCLEASSTSVPTRSSTWMFWCAPGNGENAMMGEGYPEGGFKGIASPLWWCYQWQLHRGGARFELLRQPRDSQLPAEALSRDPTASHVHFATKPLKGIPWDLLFAHWTPALWSADPMCFRGTEVIILWPCHVILLIQMFVWSFTGNA